LAQDRPDSPDLCEYSSRSEFVNSTKQAPQRGMPLSSVLGCNSVQLKTRQLDSLQALVTKHVQDTELSDMATSDDFSQTSLERGLARWQQAHLVAALDVLNSYQRERRSRLFKGPLAPTLRSSYKADPRTRMVELLKRWLRSRAACSTLSEAEVRGISGLCRDILNYPELFPAKNPRSFLCTIAEVLEHLQWQLQEVLEKDRSCANLAQEVISLSKNLVSDAITFLLLAATDLSQTDALPSLEVVSLWQSLPDEGHPLPDRKDVTLQRVMKEAWQSRCGAIIGALLCTTWCVRLFSGADLEPSMLALENWQTSADGKSVKDLLTEAREDLPLFITETRAIFSHGRYKNSALVGALRAKAKEQEDYFQVVLAVYELMYLVGEVMVQFHRISDGLGDYGMIRVAVWLHPFLQVLSEKVHRLKYHLERVNASLEAVYVLGRARGLAVEKPAPSTRMFARASAALGRAIVGKSSHVEELMKTVEQLKARSAPERLPHVAKELSDACMTLQHVLASTEFRAVAGDAFSELPTLIAGPISRPASESQSDFSHQLAIAGTPSTSCTEIEVRGFDEARSKVPINHLIQDAERKEVSGAECHSKMLTAEVCRLGSRFLGSRRLARSLEQRILTILNGELCVFSKADLQCKELSVHLPAGVERCLLLSDRVLDIRIARIPKGAHASDGVMEFEECTFEFTSSESAQEFYREFHRLGVVCMG
jgi:hypothetical protein